MHSKELSPPKEFRVPIRRTPEFTWLRKHIPHISLELRDAHWLVSVLILNNSLFSDKMILILKAHPFEGTVFPCNFLKIKTKTRANDAL